MGSLVHRPGPNVKYRHFAALVFATTQYPSAFGLAEALPTRATCSQGRSFSKRLFFLYVLMVVGVNGEGPFQSDQNLVPGDRMEFEQLLLAYEPAIRLGCFVGVFAVVALWELAAPRRAPTVSKALRWVSNLGLVALNTLVLRLLFPLAAVGMAASGVAHGWGLLNQLQLPSWLALPLAVIALDFAIWLQHVMVHAVPALWRLHQVHHADPDYDLTTGSRFHPVEIVLSMLVKFATIAVLGAPVLAVLVFEVLLNAMAMFNHGNIRLPVALDRVLRWFFVTPDMHRVHHSVDHDETNSNFGFNMPWWDRLFGTYRDQPRAGHDGIVIGLHGHTDPREVARLDGMLLMPFKAVAEGYAINRRQGADRRDG
jgi:sterol desaturase/sphingolipid hydroxylase (fatty acid hydroxylase superfamily)